MSPISSSRRYDREIFRLAIPALGTLAADPLVSLVDTAFVGRLGALALGALGVNASVFGLTFVIFNFLAYGITPMVGMAIGKGDREGAGQIAFQGLILAGLMGIGIAVMLEVFAHPILGVMGAFGSELGDDLATMAREMARDFPDKPLVYFLYGPHFETVRAKLEATGTCLGFSSPERAARALTHLRRRAMFLARHEPRRQDG